MRRKKYSCVVCGDPIEDGEDLYRLPGDALIHRDCLLDWARLWLETARYDTQEGDYED